MVQTSESESGATRIGSMNFAGRLGRGLGAGRDPRPAATAMWPPFGSAELFWNWNASIPPNSSSDAGTPAAVPGRIA